ncbi:histidinol-phosphate transaminase [candidate division KSB1 bacterium]|nr:histidinol-phosphate transaminase [candidate division KSB1 bacterium]
MIEPRALLKNAVPYSAPKEIRAGKIRLDKNESGVGCSPKVLEALKNISTENVAMYPEYPQLMRKLSEFWGVPESCIMLANGADEAIRYVAETYIDPGDEVIIPCPTFSMFEILFQNAGARIEKILYNDDLAFPTERVLKSISGRTRAIVIVSPNSPTGSSIPGEALLQILKRAPQSLILLDETYSHFTGETAVDLIAKFHNLFILKTFSKISGFAGLRLGNVLSDEKNIANLNKVRLPYCVNSLAIIAGCAALDDKAFIEIAVEANRIEKEFLYEELEKLGLVTYKTDANFILVKFGCWRDLVYHALHEKGVLLRNMKEHALITDCLRISIGTRKQHELLLAALREVLPPQALLFDMDGVLVDVSNSYRMAIKLTAEYFSGGAVSLAEIQELKDRGGYNNDWDLTEAIIKSRGKTINRKEIVDQFQRFYLGKNFDALLANERWLFKSKVLDTLSTKFKLGIVTGRPRVEAMHALERYGVKRYFDVVIAMEDVPEDKQKPDPMGVKMAIRQLGVRRAAYLGDTIDDIKAAAGASAIPVAVITEQNQRSALLNAFKQHGATYILKNVNEIVEVWNEAC